MRRLDRRSPKLRSRPVDNLNSFQKLVKRNSLSGTRIAVGLWEPSHTILLSQ